MKHTPSRDARNRTQRQKRLETPDRRVQRTKTSLHSALIGLAREKPYPAIAVKEITDRANVGRSTFYMHFRDKDDLLESGIHEVVGSIHDRPRSDRVLDRIVAFSLPLLTHIDSHRRAARRQIEREGRVAMHRRLQDVLTTLVSEELALVRRDQLPAAVSADLLARHVAATFVLVLDWWIDHGGSLTPKDADDRFRALVTPVLVTR